MPGSEPLAVDLRFYRPAAVLLIDLVKHSSRDQSTTMAVQSVLSEVLRSTVASLYVSDAHFNHTGDGYVCTFIGDASARILDFVNAFYPELTRRMAPFAQAIRGGLAFGLVHFRKDSLTQTDTHFDLPGIEAARLEQAAQPGQILSTVTVHSIFQRHYPHMFSRDSISVQTKDRTLTAYEVTPCAAWNIEIRQRLTDFLFRRPTEAAAERSGRLLLVEDDEPLRSMLARSLADVRPQREVLHASSAAEGLAIFEKLSCAVVVTDMVMPGMSGIEMIRRMKERVPDQVVVGISGYASDEMCSEFYRAGGFIFVAKPFLLDEMARIIEYALKQPHGDVLRQQLATVCDDIVAFWSALHDVAIRIGSILRSVGSGSDVAQELLRHKAKHLINEGIARLGPGTDPVEQLLQLAVQLACVERLARVVGRLGIQKIGPFLSTLIADLRRVHARVEFMLNDDVSEDIEAEIRFGGVVVLAIVELLDNAAAAVGERGRVEVELAALKAAGILQVTVKDSGPGVPAEIESRMFEENVSTKGSGRGMGLHLVREAVRLLRGSITYDRRDGSVFCVRLPLTS